MGGWGIKRRQEEINRICITRKQRARKSENPFGYFIVIKMRNNEDLNLVAEGIEKRLRFE